jgi:transposase
LAPPSDDDHGCAWRVHAGELTTRVAELEAKLSVLERALFGKKSEKGKKKMPPVPKAPVSREAADTKRQQRAAAREAAIETVLEPIPVPDADKVCTLCGGTEFRPVGDGKTCDILEYVQPHFRRRRLVRETIACRCGGCVLTAPAPQRWSDKCRYASSFVAYLCVSKCRGAMPFYRLEGLSKCAELPIARSTMNDLFHRAGDKCLRLEPVLFEAIRADFLVLADETTFKLTTQKSKAFMWTFLGATLTGYRFALTRGGDVPLEALKDSKGVLVCDDYRGYDPLCAKGHRRRCGCLAHARRKFFDAGNVPEATQALALIGFLYGVEHEAERRNVLGTPDHATLRRTYSRPAFAALLQLARRTRANHAPKTLLGKAARYFCRNSRALAVFLEDPHIPPDNNRSENAMRIVGLGRKNFMFVQSELAGRHLAILYSLIGSCERAGINPIKYLTDLLDRIDNVADADLRDLLPDRWKPPPKPAQPVDFEAE